MQSQTRPWRLNIMAFFPERPKCDQNPKFTPLSETTSIPASFIWDSPPGLLTTRISHSSVVEHSNRWSHGFGSRWGLGRTYCPRRLCKIYLVIKLLSYILSYCSKISNISLCYFDLRFKYNSFCLARFFLEMIQES